MNAGWNVAFFGSSLCSTFWNAAATHCLGMIRALARRGHRITFFEPDAVGATRRDPEGLPWARLVSYPADGEDAAASAVAEAARADLIVNASGVGTLDGWLETALFDTPHHAPVVFWDFDPAATLDRIQADPADSARELIPRYDLVLTNGGGDPVVTAYTLLGARRCEPIYRAFDPSTHHPALADPRYACDLAFLGNRMPNRETRVEQLFLAPARRLSRSFLVLGGSGWDARPLPQNVAAVGHVLAKDHNAFYVSARAVLHIGRDNATRYGFSPAPRLLEAAGAGACVLTDAWDGIEMFLEPDAEVLLARNGDDVVDQLSALTPSRAAAIGMLARRRVLAEHTYEHRARQLEDTLRDAGLDARRGAA